MTIQDIKDKYERGEKLVMLTAYDFALAKLVDACVDMVLVGDSLANVFLGKDSTRSVDMDIMVYHAQAVRRGIEKAVLIGDMPFSAYQTNPEEAVDNARRFMDEAGCDAVKVEWFGQCPEVVENLTANQIPVMGHVGLTPQNAESPEDFKVKGRQANEARTIVKNAQRLAELGCFAIVLECVPQVVAQRITDLINVPTIGIGAGPSCSGQVLVIHDLLGLIRGFRPKFAKKYVDAGDLIEQGIKAFRDEVVSGEFPSAEYSFTMRPDEQALFDKEAG